MRDVYIALEEINHDWTPEEVKRFDQMWKAGYSTWEIARAFIRPIDDVNILVYDRCYRKKIKPRKGGLNGTL
jgi:hypothetical protein